VVAVQTEDVVGVTGLSINGVHVDVTSGAGLGDHSDLTSGEADGLEDDSVEVGRVIGDGQDNTEA